jgi:hypothetical protein
MRRRLLFKFFVTGVDRRVIEVLIANAKWLALGVFVRDAMALIGLSIVRK